MLTTSSPMPPVRPTIDMEWKIPCALRLLLSKLSGGPQFWDGKITGKRTPRSVPGTKTFSGLGRREKPFIKGRLSCGGCIWRNQLHGDYDLV